MPTVRDRSFRLGLRLASRVHRRMYRLSGGRIGGRVWDLPILLLTTTGRTTGRTRTTPLCYLRDGDRFVVIASNGGRDWFPDWWLNLVQDPQATVEVGATRHAVVSHAAAPDERARLWATLTAIAPGYLAYERRTQREIPLAVLEPS